MQERLQVEACAMQGLQTMKAMQGYGRQGMHVQCKATAHVQRMHVQCKARM